jgi:hypothetical protein
MPAWEGATMTTRREVRTADGRVLRGVKSDNAGAIEAQKIYAKTGVHAWVVRITETTEWDSRKAYPNGYVPERGPSNDG